MKHLLPKVALALAGVAFMTQAAHAQYDTGDLILVLRNPGNPGAVPPIAGTPNDYLVDLGAASTFTGASSSITTTLSLSALNSTLGTGWQNNSLVQWTVLGDDGGNTLPSGDDILYYSKVQTPAGTQNTTGFARQSGSTQDNAGSDIETIGGNIASGTTATPADATLGYGPNSSSFPSSKLLNNFAGGFAGSLSDLTMETPNNTTGTTGSVYGTFSWATDASNGSLVDFIYNVTPVPEPTTYGLFAAAGLLGLSLNRQFRRKQA